MVGFMTFEETLESAIRKVLREEMRAFATEDRLLTAEQVGEILGYSVHQVHRLKREKKLNGFMLGENSLRFRRSEVERFIQLREAAA